MQEKGSGGWENLGCGVYPLHAQEHQKFAWCLQQGSVIAWHPMRVKMHGTCTMTPIHGGGQTTRMMVEFSTLGVLGWILGTLI